MSKDRLINADSGHSPQEILLNAKEMTPELVRLLSPEIAEFAKKIIAFRKKMVVCGLSPRRDYCTRELTEIWQDNHVQYDPILKEFYRLLFSIETNGENVSKVSYDSWRKWDDLFRLIADDWIRLERLFEKITIPQDSLVSYDVYLLTIGTFKNFGGNLWGNRVSSPEFDLENLPRRDDVIAQITRNQQSHYEFEGGDPSGPELTLDPGAEPILVDIFQSKEKIADILNQATYGDVLHISPSPTSPKFDKLAPFFARIGLDSVQIHGMVEAIINSDGEKRIRLMSPYFATLCDLSGRQRGAITEEDRTFGQNDIQVIHRDSAVNFISRETKNRFRAGQLVQFMASDVNGHARTIIMKVEGYFSGWIQGVIVDNDPEINGFRTARQAKSVRAVADDE